MAGVVVEMSGREQQLLSSIAKLEKEVDTLKLKYADVGRAGKKSGEDIGRSMKRGNDEGFGSKAMGQLTSYIGGFVSLGAAIGAVVKSFQAMNRVREEGAQKIRESEMGMAQLTQLAMGDPVKLQGLIRGAKDIYRGGGAATLDQASRTMFALESAGAGGLQERDLFSKLFGIIKQPDVMARAATTLLTSMGPKETGGLRAIMSKGFAASQFAPATAEEMLEASSRGSGLAGMLGMRDESVLAAVSLLSQATGSAEQGGTQFASLLTAMVKKGGYKGMSLPQAVRQIQGMGMADEELVKYLGRKEALRGFTTLTGNLPELEKRMGAIGAAQEGDLLGDLIASRQAQPELAAALIERQARAEAELANQFGVGRMLSNAAMERFTAERRMQGKNELGTQLIGWSHRWHQRLGMDMSLLEHGGDPELRRIYEAAETGQLLEENTPAASLERAASHIERTAQNMAGGPLMAAPHEDR